MKTKNKIIIIGLDGMTWDLVKKYKTKGHFSHLQEIKNSSISGNLRSTAPPVTAPAWISFQTGISPLKHGIYDFMQHDKKGLRKLSRWSSVQYKSIFELLADKGKKVITINLPFSPDDRKNLDVIKSWTYPGKDNQDYYSEKIFKKYKTLSNYIPINLHKDVHSRKGKILMIKKICKHRLELFREIINGNYYDVFFGLFSAPDWLQHRLFEDLISEKSSDETRIALEAYQMIDTFLGDIFSLCKKKDIGLVLLSDHGFRAYDGRFYINTWLEQKGYLQFTGKRRGSNIDEKHEIKTSHTVFELNKLVDIFIGNKMLNPLASKLYKIANKLFGIKVKVNRNVDTKNSEAWCSSSLSKVIHLKKNISAKQKTALKKRLIKELSTLKSIEPIELKWSKDVAREFYLPDLFIFSEKYKIKKNLIKSNNYFVKGLENDHDFDGIYCIYKNGVKPRESDASILDLAPTILRYYGAIMRISDGKTINLNSHCPREVEILDNKIGYKKIIDDIEI